MGGCCFFFPVSFPVASTPKDACWHRQSQGGSQEAVSRSKVAGIQVFTKLSGLHLPLEDSRATCPFPIQGCLGPPACLFGALCEVLSSLFSHPSPWPALPKVRGVDCRGIPGQAAWSTMEALDVRAACKVAKRALSGGLHLRLILADMKVASKRRKDRPEGKSPPSKGASKKAKAAPKKKGK